MNSKNLTLVVCLLIVATIPLLAGVPSISIDIPAKPFDEASRGASLLVHARWCDPGFPNSVTGSAEGIVNGKHQTLQLRLIPTSQEGVYAVNQQWPSEGAWVLTITVNEHMAISSVVTLGKNGSATGASVQTLTRKATDADVAAALKTIL